MKQNSIFEIICLALALAGMLTKTIADLPEIKQLGGLALYGLSSIAVISKAYRFRHLPATIGQKLTIGAGILFMLVAAVGEAIDPERLYNALWLLGMLATGMVTNKLYKDQQNTAV